MYQLTPLLTTVASCSATIIAIIGGFMVRKLIAMSTERHEISMRLAEMDEEIRFKKDRAGQLADILSNEADTAVSRENERLYLDIRWDEFRRKQLAARLDSLKNPHGMKRGLLVLVVFSILGVLLPLSLIPFETDRYAVFISIKSLILFLLAFCLAYVYHYLLYLLRWKNRDVVSRWKEYFRPPSDKSAE